MSLFLQNNNASEFLPRPYLIKKFYDFTVSLFFTILLYYSVRENFWKEFRSKIIIIITSTCRAIQSFFIRLIRNKIDRKDSLHVKINYYIVNLKKGMNTLMMLKLYKNIIYSTLII